MMDIWQSCECLDQVLTPGESALLLCVASRENSAQTPPVRTQSLVSSAMRSLSCARAMPHATHLLGLLEEQVSLADACQPGCTHITHLAAEAGAGPCGI